MQAKDKPRKRRIATMTAYMGVIAALVIGINGPLTSGAQGPTGPTGPVKKAKKCFHKHAHKHGKGKGQVKHNHKHKCVGNHHKKKHFLPNPE